MRLYLDTSVLVSALTDEAQTPRTQAWLGRQNSGSLAISEWVVTEFSSALSIKLRAGQISVANRADALALFARLRTESFEFLPISDRNFELPPGLQMSTHWDCALATRCTSPSAQTMAQHFAHSTGAFPGPPPRLECR